MSMTAITNEIDDDILFERHTEIKRQLCDKENCFGIITIDMKDRRIDHFGDITGIQG